MIMNIITQVSDKLKIYHKLKNLITKLINLYLTINNYTEKRDQLKYIIILHKINSL